MRFVRKTKEKLLIKSLIREFKNIAKKKIKYKRRFSFVLTGGPSPINLYKSLSKEKIEWENIDFFWGDERLVPKNSKFSNYKLVKTNLLKDVKVSKKQIFSVDTIQNSLSLSSRLYSKKIKRYFKYKKVVFDLVLLGMGNDGHIASIFPENLNLKSNKITKYVLRKDFKRISLNMKIINNSKNIFLWLNNKKKSKIFKSLKEYKKKHVPVNFLNYKKTTVFSLT